MNEYGTILIPQDMSAVIEIIDADLTARTPVHVAQVCKENPDEFGLAFYSSHYGEKIGTNELFVNDRATMIARAVGDRIGEIVPTLTGDIILQCDKELSDLIVSSDQKFTADSKIIKAFRTWMQDYASYNDLEIDAVFHAVAGYAGHILAEAEAKQEADMQQALAAMMGIRPEQIGVIRL